MTATVDARRRGDGGAPDEGASTLLEATGLSQQIGFAMRFAQAAVWDDLVATLRPLGLRPVQYSILLILGAMPGARQQEIGDALSVKRPNLVSLLDELEGRGLLRRTAHPQDRRSHSLYLTDAGRALLVVAGHAHDSHRRRLDALFTTDERRTLIESLRKLAGLRTETEAPAPHQAAAIACNELKPNGF
jgi:DNA-binding MarR family transcriptional regulator